MAHIVIAPAVQVTAGARTHFIETGSLLPDGVPADVLERLVSEEMIAVVVEEIDEGVYKDVSVKDLKAELGKRNEGRDGDAKIIPADPGNRPEIVAALLADDTKQS